METKDQFDKLLESLKDFITLKVRIAELKIADRISNIIGSIIPSLIVIIFSLLGFFFFSISLAVWIGSLLDNYALGFLFVGSICIFLAMVVISWGRHFIKKKIIDAIIKIIFNK